MKNICVFGSQVHLQTQQQAQFGMVGMGIRVFQTDGLRGLYNGISASLLRQVFVQCPVLCLWPSGLV